MDGASGPGVGSATSAVQGGVVGMMIGIGGVDRATVAVGVVAQETNRKKDRKTLAPASACGIEKNRLMVIFVL